MTTKSPAVGRLLLAGSKLRADLAQAVTSISLSYDVGSLAELTVTSQDPAGALARSDLGRTGTTVTFDGEPWQVGAVDGDFAAGIAWTFSCRSRLAKQLRRTYRVSAKKNVSPSDWIRQAAAAAGGTAVVRPSTKKTQITQAGGDQPQTELDVINSLAGDQDWQWVEYGNSLYVGHPHDALDGLFGLPTWPVTWKKQPATDALTLKLSLDDDDKESAGTGELTVPHDAGLRLRPWHRLQLAGAGGFDGLWLVSGVEITRDGVTPVQVSITRPRPPVKKAGSKAVSKK